MRHLIEEIRHLVAAFVVSERWWPEIGASVVAGLSSASKTNSAQTVRVDRYRPVTQLQHRQQCRGALAAPDRHADHHGSDTRPDRRSSRLRDRAVAIEV